MEAGIHPWIKYFVDFESGCIFSSFSGVEMVRNRRRSSSNPAMKSSSPKSRWSISVCGSSHKRFAGGFRGVVKVHVVKGIAYKKGP